MLIQSLTSEVKRSLLSGDRFRAETIKLVLAACTNARIDKGSELTDDEVVAVLQREIKKRKESAEIYTNANAQDRAEKELAEVSVLEEFTPKLIEGQELLEKFEEFLAQYKAEVTQQQMGVIIKAAIDYIGNPDKGQLAALLKNKLAGNS